MTHPWLAILGINEDATLSPEAARLLSHATLVMGGARHLALAAPHIRGQAHPWPHPITASIPILLAHRPNPAAILASGDPLWFGIATTLLRHVPVSETRIIPAPSSFALAAARLGWPLDTALCLSCCGRPVAALRPHLREGARLLVLSADATTPHEVARHLTAWGFSSSTLHILESLAGPAERIRTATPATIPPATIPPDIVPLNMLAIEVSGAPGLPLTPGLPDTLFDHDGQITKSEIRALTLAALAPRPGELLWDIGAGSGSIGIEWMLRHPANRAIGLERHPARAARARANAQALGTPAYQMVEGQAPEALPTLPPPNAIFLGAAAHTPGVIETAWNALPPGGRLVANAIALPTESALANAQAKYGGTLLRIALERLDQVGTMPAYRPAMTVTQWTLTK